RPWRHAFEGCAALQQRAEPVSRGLLGRHLQLPRPGASRADEHAPGTLGEREFPGRAEGIAVRAYPATAMLQEMRSLRAGSDITDRLDNALATKLVGVLRFRRHHFMAA